MYNIIKVERRDTWNEVQMMFLSTIRPLGLPVGFHIKHSVVMKIKTHIINCSKIVCSWLCTDLRFKWSSGECWRMEGSPSIILPMLGVKWYCLDWFPVNARKCLLLMYQFSLTKISTGPIPVLLNKHQRKRQFKKILSLRPSFKGIQHSHLYFSKKYKLIALTNCGWRNYCSLVFLI